MRADRLLLSLGLLLVATACSLGSGESIDRVATTITQPPAVPAECGGYLPRNEVGAWELGMGTGVRGMVASRKHPDLVWVLKEIEQRSELEAYSASDGQVVAGMRLPGGGTTARDVAIGPGPEDETDYLYVADIGNAEKPIRQTVAVHRFAEPDPADPAAVESEQFEFQYEDRPRDAQAMFVDPETGDIFVIAVGRGAPGVYVAQAPFTWGEVATLRLLGTISPPANSLVVGADITASGETIAVRTGTSMSVWDRAAGQSIIEAMTSEPCIGELRNPERDGAFAFTGQAREFYSLSLGGGDPTLFVQRPPVDLAAAVGGLAVPPEPGNLAPVVTIAQPTSDLTWTVGDTIPLEAAASDDQDVDPARFSWDVAVEHCPAEDSCLRRGIAEVAGASAEAVTREVGFTFPVYLEVTVTYTDPAGLLAQDSTRLLPKSSTITFTSNPVGAQLTIGDELTTTPATREVLLDDIIRVQVEPVQAIDGVTYEFTGWSDGGGRAHQLDITEETLELSMRLEPRTRWEMEGVNLETFAGDYIRINADDRYELYVNGDFIGSNDDWQKATLHGIDLTAGDVVAVRATDDTGQAGLIAEIFWDGQTTVTNGDWLLATAVSRGWAEPSYDTSRWGNATEYAMDEAAPWLARVDSVSKGSRAQWIWSDDNVNGQEVFVRTTLG